MDYFQNQYGLIWVNIWLSKFYPMEMAHILPNQPVSQQDKFIQSGEFFEKWRVGWEALFGDADGLKSYYSTRLLAELILLDV